MDAMTLLHERSSMGKLIGPPPSPDQLEAIYRAALRAPDHKELRPWRFIEFSGEGLSRLGSCLPRRNSARTRTPAIPCWTRRARSRGGRQ